MVKFGDKGGGKGTVAPSWGGGCGEWGGGIIRDVREVAPSWGGNVAPSWGGDGGNVAPSWGGDSWGGDSWGGNACGKMGNGFGKGFGKSSSSSPLVQLAQMLAPHKEMLQSMQGFVGKGFSKGSGKDDRHENAMRSIGQMRAEVKVWVGGLPEDIGLAAVKKHFKDLTCEPSMCELLNNGKNPATAGTAVMVFQSAEEASNAALIANGTEIAGHVIQVDGWKRTDGGQVAKVRKSTKIKNKDKPSTVKKVAADFEKMTRKLAAKIEGIDSSLKVQVTGLKDTTEWKEVKSHFNTMGVAVELCGGVVSGTSCVTFKSAEEATSSIAVMNGSMLFDGTTIMVRAWGL